LTGRLLIKNRKLHIVRGHSPRASIF